MNIGTKTTYWKFIQEHGITIPVIQRDYAQGRDGKEVLRRRLLENIKSCLDTKQELVLDFVYGMTSEGNINPLDGQQRLTTLWLLHWYLLLKSGYIKKENLECLSRFTYETRLSSRNFCECLCRRGNLENLKASKNIRKDIENQTWFMAEWKQDPTVKAMLNMLGGESSIEKIFNKDHKHYWESLVDENNCPIKFYYLSLDGEIAQRPDDIYIKMNARGEHLTDFENFKADLVKFVREKSLDLEELKDKSVNPELYLSECIDSTWTDVFWSQLNEKDKQPFKSTEHEKAPNVDKQLFAFLNRYFLNCIFAEKDLNYKMLNAKDPEASEDNNIKKNKDFIRFYQYVYGDGGVADVDIKYTDFALYEQAKLITSDKFKALINIFEILKDTKDTKVADIVKQYATPQWIEKSTQEFVFFPQMKGDKIEPITQPQRVVFYGICCYLENCKNNQSFTEESFSEWLRFVWNMARNSDVDTVDNMIKVIKKIKVLKDHTHSIKTGALESSEELSQDSSYFDRQWKEEILKFEKLDDKKEFILKAEKLFHGNISFLLNEENDLLNKDSITKAKELIYEVENGKVKTREKINEYNGSKKEKIAYKENWFLEVLPYFPSDIFDGKDNYILTFHEKTGDVVKNINHDDNIIKAVQAYLKDKGQKLKEDAEKWIYPLVNIMDKKSEENLFGYSDSKLIRRQKNGIFLYKKTHWKKEQCILLWSDDKTTQQKLLNRNKFIANLAEDKYLLVDGDEKIIQNLSDANYGRPIILKGDNDTYYCGVDGYWENDKKEIVSYENN